MFAANAGGSYLEYFYQQVDKETLTRWAFVPRCTEFIVEWSYGWTFGDEADKVTLLRSHFDATDHGLMARLTNAQIDAAMSQAAAPAEGDTTGE